jgi:hypothetical protein
MRFYREERAKQYGESNFRKVQEIAAGGEDAAFLYFRSIDLDGASVWRCQGLARQCREFLERVREPYWRDRSNLYVVGLCEMGPAVEAV